MPSLSAETSEDEVPFRFEELFFSRTNEHGIIQSGNSVFQRISGYSWEELVGKPHKLVRHRDMPRAVFWLLWDTIRRNETIGAYVKNRAKDGRSYWVFAVVAPTSGGYLSVRLKPSSPLFETVRQEYAALRERELETDMAPADSAARLLARLSELGFSDYPTFMAEAIRAEVAGRDIQIGRAEDPAVLRFGEVVEASRTALSQADRIFTAFGCNEYVALNFRVQAAQLGSAGAAINQISQNYDLLSTEIKRSLEKFVGSAKLVAATVNNGAFLTCMARVQSEVLHQFERETADSQTINAEEMRRLQQQVRNCHKVAIEGLQGIRAKAVDFRDHCADMKRLAAALEVTRIMGKVESSREKRALEALAELISDLEAMQKAIAGGLKEIEQSNYCVLDRTNDLLERRGTFAIAL
jgi:aerotaxis receptor